MKPMQIIKTIYPTQPLMCFNDWIGYINKSVGIINSSLPIKKV